MEIPVIPAMLTIQAIKVRRSAMLSPLAMLTARGRTAALA
jgi:hypothetical protein